MLEVVGDLWEFHKAGEWIAITTNGDVNKNGEAVMGRGVALQAKKKLPFLAADLAQCLFEGGNYPYAFRDINIVTFPVKRHWFEKADLKLIVMSAQILVALLDGKTYDFHPERLYLPRPGCGNGRLDWRAVKPLLEPIFDDRFTIVNYGMER